MYHSFRGCILKEQLQILPFGFRTLEDYQLIDFLKKDEIFLNSMQIKYGTIKNVTAIWKDNILRFEFMDYSILDCDLLKMVKKLKDINYIKEWIN